MSNPATSLLHFCFYIVAIFGAVTHAQLQPSSTSSSSTFASPFLYISFHGGSGSGAGGTVATYSLQGQLIDWFSTIGTDPATLGKPPAYRSMLLMPNNSLLIVNSNDFASSILTFGPCSVNSPRRTYLNEVTPANAAQSHPYGIALTNTSLFVTNQDTNNLVQFDALSGLFIRQVAWFGGDAVRSIAYDSSTGILWLADSSANTVFAFNTLTSGAPLPAAQYNYNSSSGVASPIGLWLNQTSRLLFVGNNNGKKSSVLAFNIDSPSRAPVQQYAGGGLNHPAGIVDWQGQLFVICQNCNPTAALLVFDLASGAFLNTLVSSFPTDVPEQILLVPACTAPAVVCLPGVNCPCSDALCAGMSGGSSSSSSSSSSPSSFFGSNWIVYLLGPAFLILALYLAWRRCRARHLSAGHAASTHSSSPPAASSHSSNQLRALDVDSTPAHSLNRV